MADRTIMSRASEIGAWFPFLGLLTLVGGASALEGADLMSLPSSLQPLLELYRGSRDWITEVTMGRTFENAMIADLAVAGVGAGSMAMRRVVSYVLSIGGFIALAVVAWFLLRTFA